MQFKINRSQFFKGFLFSYLFILVPVFSQEISPRNIEKNSHSPSTTGTAQDAEKQIVGDIEFRGNTLNKSRSLERKIKTKRDQILDRKKLQGDVKILFETGDFDDVSVEIEEMNIPDSKARKQGKVVFIVSERAITKRIDYKGNRKVRSSVFIEKIQSKEGDPFDRFKAALDERTILEYYRDEGYANAKVEHYTSIDDKNKKLILTFFIIEGERIMVRNLSVLGSKNFSEKALIGKMKTRRKKVYKEETLSQDQMKLLAFYKNKGFLDVEISSPNVIINQEKNEASLSLSVVEGSEYKIGDVSFEGATLFTEKELRKAVVVKKGTLFQQIKLDETVANISTLYADKGYLRT
ncbi:MAG: POTRA domain-containing protein [Elusimicrobiota bacterium]